uniref:Uncharacterized protein n=1 Tax=Oryza nivara TaxID=4536 RepID=A0A0E0HWJ1_ORYNI
MSASASPPFCIHAAPDLRRGRRISRLRKRNRMRATISSLASALPVCIHAAAGLHPCRPRSVPQEEKKPPARRNALPVASPPRDHRSPIPRSRSPPLSPPPPSGRHSALHGSPVSALRRQQQRQRGLLAIQEIIVKETSLRTILFCQVSEGLSYYCTTSSATIAKP